MPANTTNQQITYPIGTDLADNPLAFTDMLADAENRLAQRYTSAIDRAARNPAPNTGEISWIAGNSWYERYTGAKWIPFTSIQAVKTANQIVNNSTAFVNDAALAVTAPAASTVYAFEATIGYLSTTVADIKFQLSVPVGAAYNITGAGLATGAAGVTGDMNAAWSSTTLAFGGGGADTAVMLSGLVSVAATTGTVTLQWAQNTLEATNTTVYARSWIRLLAIQ